MGNTLTAELKRDLAYKRNLQIARVDYENSLEKEKQEHIQKVAHAMSVGRFGAQAFEGDHDNQSAKSDIRELQGAVKRMTKDQEAHRIIDDATDVFTGSKMAMPVNVIKAAVHAREALHDYGSKWWIVGFAIAAFKDTVGDISYFFGLMAQVFLLIFLFGGGFLRKQIGKQVLKRLIIPILIGLIPGLNVIIPDAILQVFIRWNISRKESHKAKARLEKIERYSEEYDEEQ